MNKKQRKVLIRIIITTLIIIAYILLGLEEHKLALLFYALPYFIIGYDILKKAFKKIGKKDVFDENFLMAVATIGSIFLKEYQEAVAVMLFYQIGELFQSYAISKSRKNISELMDIKPEYANLLNDDGSFIQKDPSEIAIGSLIIVKVGEKIPIDGIVIKGQSSLNTSALTGESLPRNVYINDEVISGCINMEGPLTIKTTKAYQDSTVAKVLDLVENATNNKSKSEDFITKFARYYTPVVCFGALFIMTVVPLFCLFFFKEANFYSWFSKALTFLVISCPCALVISIPLTFFAGIGGASNKGILIKGSNYLETLSKTKYVVLDKTGTMTKGIFEVSGIHHSKLDEDELLKYAATAEVFSNHPIAKCIVKEYGKEIDTTVIESIKEIPGKGIKAKIYGDEVLVGNTTLMQENAIEYIECHHVGTIVHIAINSEYMGHLLICDMIKITSKKTIEELKRLGIKKTIMLTGDKQDIGENVANELNIDEVYTELLPNQKIDIIEDKLKQKNNKDSLIFVGDGINDAPSISRADIGISMGALGSDAAIEAADVVLMDDDPLNIVKSIVIAKKCMHIVYENIYFAIGVKAICLVLSVFGYTSMWMAIFADVGVMIIDVINAIRALYSKKL